MRLAATVLFIPMAVLAVELPVTANQEFRKLLPSDAAADDRFGQSVSLDGGLALVGAHYHDALGISNSGAAYVLDAISGQQLFKLVPADAGPGKYFAWSVAIDDGLALAGAYADDDNGAESGSAYVFDVGPGTSFGGGGSAYPCPCGNQNDDTLAPLLAGCDNGQHTSGAVLHAGGVASVSNDTLVLTGAYLKNRAWGVLLQGDLEDLPGTPLGTGPNGLLQIQGNLTRLGLVRADETGHVDSAALLATSGQTLSSLGAVVPGNTRSYQLWYRNPNASAPCTLGDSGGSNTTNGYTISWLP